MNTLRKMFLLRIFLVTGAFGWGVSILAVLLPWTIAENALEGLGAENIRYCPMLDYWLRMAGGAFTVIGVIFAAAAVKPLKYLPFIPLLGYLNIFEGLILLFYGMKLGLRPFPFYSDAGFCLLVGAGIILLSRKITQGTETSDK